MWPFNGKEFKYIHTRLNDFGRQLTAPSRWDYDFVYSRCAKIYSLAYCFDTLNERVEVIERRINEQDKAVVPESKPKSKPKAKPKTKTKRTRKQGK